ncbi:MAG: hypothetical protein JW717_13525 [Marinilabiliaceae bacterium]|nr:hypothetical protein [Marinilabiliaceae bacterium]
MKHIFLFIVIVLMSISSMAQTGLEISNGVVLAYTGNDTVLTIPVNVHTIGFYVFSNKNAKKILVFFSLKFLLKAA